MPARVGERGGFGGSVPAEEGAIRDGWCIVSFSPAELAKPRFGLPAVMGGRARGVDIPNHDPAPRAPVGEEQRNLDQGGHRSGQG
jgi:hypothetical protein